MIESNARSAQSEFGKPWRAITAPLMTLEELCNRYAPAEIDFLKVDVEGAEQDVLLHGNWYKHRPKIVIAEALAPYTLAPAWEGWEPCLTKHGYRYIWFDTLNRYYIAEEAAELASCFTQGSAGFEAAFQFRNVKPALVDDFVQNAHRGHSSRCARQTRWRSGHRPRDRAPVRAARGAATGRAALIPFSSRARRVRRHRANRPVLRGLRADFRELRVVASGLRGFGLPRPYRIRYTAKACSAVRLLLCGC